MITKVNKLLISKDRKNIIFLLLFSILIAIIETAGISAIMPFISVATNFDMIETNKYFSYFYNLFGFTNNVSFVIAFGVILIFFYIFRSLVKILLHKRNTTIYLANYLKII